MAGLLQAVVLVAALSLTGAAAAQTPNRTDALQPDSIPPSATVRDLADGTKVYDFTNGDGSHVRCAEYALASGMLLMSCEPLEERP
jgi:hypothetical protein